MAVNYERARTDYQSEQRSKRDEKDVADWLKTHPEHSDSTNLSWARSLRNFAARNRSLDKSPSGYRRGLYRPFSTQNVYFAPGYNHERGQLPSMFPTPNHPNHGFYLTGIGAQKPFAVQATAIIPDLNFWGSEGGQFFPRYTYHPVNDGDMLAIPSKGEQDVVVEGYLRQDNVSDETLTRYQSAFGKTVTKDDIFSSIYALLHSPDYRQAYSSELKRQLPRIPLPDTAEDFGAFASTGRDLLALHIGYESVEPYPLVEEHTTGDETSVEYYRVEKLRWAGKPRTPDRSRIVYNHNVTLTGIPDEAHEYVLGSRSALEWLIDRYQVKTDKSSGIENDPNDWARENDDRRYLVNLIKRVTTVSVETQRILEELPRLTFEARP